MDNDFDLCTALRQDSERRIKDAISVIASELFSNHEKELAGWIEAAVECLHRTTQQRFWSIMLLAQIKYTDCEYDFRNEAAVKLARLVSCAAEAQNYDQGLPRI